MVTTSNEQDGASSSTPPNPPSQPEQQPPTAESSNQVSQPSPADQATEAPSPLRDGAPSSSQSDPSSQPEQQPIEVVKIKQERQSPPPELPACSTPEDTPPLTHPAPLPESPPVTNSDPSWKRPPPKIAIKIYSVPVGVVVSWHARIKPQHEEIKKFELYSYQEGRHPPSTALWKKLGDIDPLPLPMACTLSQFIGGRTYHFAIRAVDIHGRCGKFSECLSMFMEEDKVAEELRVKAEVAVKVENEDDMESEEDYDDEEEEMMESDPVKEEEGECLGSEGKDLEVKSEPLSDSVTPVKEVEKTVGCVKESEMAVEPSVEQDVSQGKEQEKAKAQAKEPDKEMVQVKEEKDRSPCSC